ncbi:hypothetical protein AB4G91_06835 [Macrococcoides goetzii]|uniref:hypothetical protein n=1 Tax=Macrococcus sp. PK TaxID=2801919 RepID=UPI001F0EBFC2|nr:hypothetical protein [Macrococcus sp. PK]MCH4984918.1 hypothetical protein [Macrococcus sp. PK]
MTRVNYDQFENLRQTINSGGSVGSIDVLKSLEKDLDGINAGLGQQVQNEFMQRELREREQRSKRNDMMRKLAEKHRIIK